MDHFVVSICLILIDALRVLNQAAFDFGQRIVFDFLDFSVRKHNT